jgi:hypothetical protein
VAGGQGGVERSGGDGGEGGQEPSSTEECAGVGVGHAAVVAEPCGHGEGAVVGVVAGVFEAGCGDGEAGVFAFMRGDCGGEFFEGEAGLIEGVEGARHRSRAYTCSTNLSSVKSNECMGFVTLSGPVSGVSDTTIQRATNHSPAAPKPATRLRRRTLDPTAIWSAAGARRGDGLRAAGRLLGIRAVATSAS